MIDPRFTQVGVLDYSTEQLNNTCTELERIYGSGKVLRLLCDVTNHEKLVSLSSTVTRSATPPCWCSMQVVAFTQTKQRFGSLDIVVNNAGIAEHPDWEKVLRINLVRDIETVLDNVIDHD